MTRKITITIEGDLDSHLNLKIDFAYDPPLKHQRNKMTTQERRELYRILHGLAYQLDSQEL